MKLAIQDNYPLLAQGREAMVVVGKLFTCLLIVV